MAFQCAIGEGDADIGGQCGAEIVIPFGGVGEESFVVDVDLAAASVVTGMVVLLGSRWSC